MSEDNTKMLVDQSLIAAAEEALDIGDRKSLWDALNAVIKGAHFEDPETPTEPKKYYVFIHPSEADMLMQRVEDAVSILTVARRDDVPEAAKEFLFEGIRVKADAVMALLGIVSNRTQPVPGTNRIPRDLAEAAARAARKLHDDTYKPAANIDMREVVYALETLRNDIMEIYTHE